MLKIITFPKIGVLFLFVLLALSNPFSAKAGHNIVYSAEMNYSHLRGDSMLLTITLYTNCTEVQIYQYDVNVIPEKSSSFKVKTKFVSSEHVNSFVKKGQCTRCKYASCALNYGINKSIFEAVIDLKNYTDCEFTFTYSDFYRYNTGENLYIETQMNRCVNGYVNSPKFSYEGIFILCKDQCAVKMHSAIGHPNDSLAYSLFHPKISAVDLHTYSQTYSYLSPIGHAKSTATCGGFTLDKQTGKLTFKPTTHGDISPMGIKVEQYYPDSTGKMVKIGEIVRDLTFLIITCPSNTSPILAAGSADITDYYVCAGNPVQINFNTMDSDAGDTVNITYMLSMKNASLTTTTNRNWNTAKFDWTPASSDVQKAPHLVMLTAYDDNGPIPGKAEKAYRIFVVGNKPEITVNKKDKGCGVIELSPVGADTQTVTSYTWHINGTVTKTKNAEFKAQKNGKYPLKLFVNNKAGCETEINDTVEIKDLPLAELGNNITLCEGTQIQLNPLANAAYKYKWQPNKSLSSDTVAKPIIKAMKTELYIVEVTNSNGCKSIDSVLVEVPEINISLSNDTFVCKNTKVTLMVKSQNNVIYKWNPSNGISNPTDTVNSFYPQQTTTYTLTAKNASGCEKTDSVKVIISATKANAGNDITICKGTSETLRGSGGKYYSWLNVRGDTLSKIRELVVSPLQTEDYYLHTQDSLRCQRSLDKVTVNVSLLPLEVMPDTTICVGDTINLWSSGGDTYSWLPNNTLTGGDTKTPKVFPQENSTYTVTIYDTIKLCSDTRSVNVSVNKDCVWPGDVNKDGIVNYKDVLEIGVGYGYSGFAREKTGNNWKAAVGKDWNKVTYNDINYKHLDCNGDGYIDAADNFVVNDNYGKIRISGFKNKAAEPTNSTIYFSFTKDTFYAGEQVVANLYLGNENNPFTNAYGAAYQYSFTANHAVSNTINFLPVCDAICTSNDFILQSLRNYPAIKSGEIAQVRTDLNNVSAKGKLAVFSYDLEDSTHNYHEKGEWIYLKLNETKLIDNQGKEYALKVVNDSALLLKNKKSPQVGINSRENAFADIRIYPNPAKNILTIENPKYFFTEAYMVNTLGQTVRIVKNIHSGKTEINIADLPVGIYFLRIETQNQYYNHKIIKVE